MQLFIEMINGNWIFLSDAFFKFIFLRVGNSSIDDDNNTQVSTPAGSRC